MSHGVASDQPLPEVSVVIPILNGESTIGSVLASLGKQAGAPTLEVIVVDNGSTDGTLAILEAASGLTLLHEPRRGPAAARNRGWRAARAGIVVFLDSDAVPTRRWLAELVRPLANPQIMAVAGFISSLPPLTGPQRFAHRYGMLEYHPDDPNTIGGPSTANVAMRQEVLRELNGFEEALLTAEDVDFWIRFRTRYGVKPVKQGGAIVLHQHRATDAELRRQAIAYGYGAGRLYVRHPDLLSWGWRQRRAAARVLILCALQDSGARLGRWTGRCSADDVEFASYRRRWNWWWWSGFLRGRGTGPT